MPNSRNRISPPQDRVRKLPPGLEALPPLIFRCWLTGVAPLQCALPRGDNNNLNYSAFRWDKSATEFFKNFIEEPSCSGRAGVELTLCAVGCKTPGGGSGGIGSGAVYQVRIDSAEEKSVLSTRMIAGKYAQDSRNVSGLASSSGLATGASTAKEV